MVVVFGILSRVCQCCNAIKMLFRGQSAVEWLIAHSWSILVVLSVGLVLFHLGVFDVEGTPRFEGLRAAGLQPVSGQVRLYSDGVMVLTVLNTRPYTMELEWVEVSPIADSGDVVRTDLNAVLTAGELGVFEVDASNIYSVSEASLILSLDASAVPSNVDFNICLNEVHSAGGQPSSPQVCGKALRIPVLDEQYGSSADCTLHQACSCEYDWDCPLECQVCGAPPGPPTYLCDNYYLCPPGTFCAKTESNPLGECVVA